MTPSYTSLFCRFLLCTFVLQISRVFLYSVVSCLPNRSPPPPLDLLFVSLNLLTYRYLCFTAQSQFLLRQVASHPNHIDVLLAPPENGLVKDTSRPSLPRFDVKQTSSFWPSTCLPFVQFFVLKHPNLPFFSFPPHPSPLLKFYLLYELVLKYYTSSSVRSTWTGKPFLFPLGSTLSQEPQYPRNSQFPCPPPLPEFVLFIVEKDVLDFLPHFYLRLYLSKSYRPLTPTNSNY